MIIFYFCREGEKKSGFWKIDEYPVPVTIICGREEGKVVCISAGVHNCEYTSIQAAIDLSEELRPENIRGSLIILHTVNYTGFFKIPLSKTRFFSGYSWRRFI